MANLKQPELKLGGNMSENFKNFELRFHDYCIQADYRNEKPRERESGLLQETFAGNIGALIGNAWRSFAGDPLRSWTSDSSLGSEKTMDLDGQITTSLHWIYRKLPTGRQI